ncbi:MAG: alpha/beta hydrolase [Pseudomonadales bacterium]|nr:alpha/beta hydrolase [Pseudomonadales bacterium]
MKAQLSSERTWRTHQSSLSGDQFCWYEWGEPEANRPSMLLVHATGFHGLCWRQVVECLPAEQHVIAPDMRGHGHTTNRGLINWAQMGADLTQLVDLWGLANAVGAGHSMGGHSLVQATAASPGAFSSLLLIDPVIKAPDIYDTATRSMPSDPSEHPVARRRSSFASPKAFADNLRGRGGYRFFTEPALMDYCEYGLIKAGGACQLACPPLVEATIYTETDRTDIMACIQAVDVPVTVLRAKPRNPEGGMDFSTSPTWPELAMQFRRGTDVFLPEMSHFIPMQDPSLVALHLETAAAIT